MFSLRVVRFTATSCCKKCDSRTDRMVRTLFLFYPSKLTPFYFKSFSSTLPLAPMRNWWLWWSPHLKNTTLLLMDESTPLKLLTFAPWISHKILYQSNSSSNIYELLLACFPHSKGLSQTFVLLPPHPYIPKYAHYESSLPLVLPTRWKVNRWWYLCFSKSRSPIQSHSLSFRSQRAEFFLNQKHFTN